MATVANGRVSPAAGQHHGDFSVSLRRWYKLSFLHFLHILTLVEKDHLWNCPKGSLCVSGLNFTAYLPTR